MTINHPKSVEKCPKCGQLISLKHPEHKCVPPTEKQRQARLDAIRQAAQKKKPTPPTESHKPLHGVTKRGK